MRRLLASLNPCSFRLTVVAVLFTLLWIHPAAAQTPQLFSDSRPAMGTTFTIHLYAPDRERATADFDAAFEEIERIEQTLSNYRPTSEISRINRSAATEPVTTDPEVFRFLQTSIDYSQRTHGAFDITVGPLMRAWGFFRANGYYPTAIELSHARTSIGWTKVRLDPAERSVRFLASGMELDPGGIGKGYAVDQVAGILREAGVTSALIDAGSSTLYAIGAPPGKSGWKVLVPRPGDRSHSVSEVYLRDNSLSTSGSYEKFFRLNGRTYCHIMDPRTGSPVQNMLQSTVIAPTATDTDALSTSIFVMGPKKGQLLLDSMPGTSALWISGTIENLSIKEWHWPARLRATKQDRSVDAKGNNTR